MTLSYITPELVDLGSIVRRTRAGGAMSSDGVSPRNNSSSPDTTANSGGAGVDTASGEESTE